MSTFAPIIIIKISCFHLEACRDGTLVLWPRAPTPEGSGQRNYNFLALAQKVNIRDVLLETIKSIFTL